MNARLLTSDHLQRGAVVYVRQSTLRQVREHTEGKRRQYELVDRARELGFTSVDVIDDDPLIRRHSLMRDPPFAKGERLGAPARAGE